MITYFIKITIVIFFWLFGRKYHVVLPHLLFVIVYNTKDNIVRFNFITSLQIFYPCSLTAVATQLSADFSHLSNKGVEVVVEL